MFEKANSILLEKQTLEDEKVSFEQKIDELIELKNDFDTEVERQEVNARYYLHF